MKTLPLFKSQRKLSNCTAIFCCQLLPTAIWSLVLLLWYEQTRTPGIVAPATKAPRGCTDQVKKQPNPSGVAPLSMFFVPAPPLK